VKRTGLFKKIFEKHLKKESTPLTSMAEDVGALKGVFSFTGYDVKTGKKVTEQRFDNMLVNESKSSIIRLLGQGRSRYLPNPIDPAMFKINKMRFSNDIGNGAGLDVNRAPRVIGVNKYEYYSIAENSRRISNVIDNHPGGAYSATRNFLETSDSQYRTEYTTERLDRLASSIVSDPVGNKIIGFKTGFLNDPVSPARHPIRPPSHGSVRVRIYKGTQLIEEVFFDNKMGTTGQDIIPAYYNKNQNDNKPYKIVNYKFTTDDKFHHVSTPTNVNSVYETVGGVRTTYINGTNNSTNSRIYYDYFTDPIGWKFYLNEIPTNSVIPGVAQGNTVIASQTGWDKIEVIYTTGLYNIINTIIPKSGVNLGYGNNNAVRYSGQQDFYLISEPTEDNYRDSEVDFIDDYSVTFTVLMQGEDGNGQATSAGREIMYRKAFLHCANDQLFSSIFIPTMDFKKSAGLAYVINWRILAPVN